MIDEITFISKWLISYFKMVIYVFLVPILMVNIFCGLSVLREYVLVLVISTLEIHFDC